MRSPAQIRAARALLGLRQIDLARRAGLSQNTLLEIEKGKSDPKPSAMAILERTLEAAGIEFLDENGGGAGVRLRKPAHGSAL